MSSSRWYVLQKTRVVGRVDGCLMLVTEKQPFPACLFCFAWIFIALGLSCFPSCDAMVSVVSYLTNLRRYMMDPPRLSDDGRWTMGFFTVTEQTKQLCAAILSNIVLHRVITEETALTSLVTLSGSTEASLVLCCAKAFANLSTYPRGRAILGNNPTVVPALVAMMRSGVRDAAQVQYLSAMALCNVLSVFLERERILSLLHEGIVEDLIATTVLRVEELRTKETLARAIFNLLCREDTRKAVANTDAVFALLRLTRLHSAALNTVCVRVIYNLTCDMQQYEDILLRMEAEGVLVTQASFPNGGVEVKKFCGAALAMMSFSKAATCALAQHAIVGALRAVSSVTDADTLQHVATTAFNLSREDTCWPALARQDVASLLLKLHGLGHSVVKTLCVASMCNLSCSTTARQNLASRVCLATLAATVRAGALSIATRLDALRAMVNLVVCYPPARQAVVEASVTAALRVILKVSQPPNPSRRRRLVQDQR